MEIHTSFSLLIVEISLLFSYRTSKNWIMKPKQFFQFFFSLLLRKYLSLPPVCPYYLIRKQLLSLDLGILPIHYRQLKSQADVEAVVKKENRTLFRTADLSFYFYNGHQRGFCEGSGQLIYSQRR